MLLGYCVNPICTISEFVENGNLLSYLKQSNNEQINDMQVLKWAKDISAGMSHLHKEQIVHRDLSTRNLLLTETLSLKITDL